MSRHHGWIFTLNNWNDEDHFNAMNLPAYKTAYFVCGYEIAPTTGTPHLQGYVNFRTARSLADVTRLVPKAHFDVARGSCKQNQKYCGKSGIYVEDGKPTQQGKRSDLDLFVDDCRSGMPWHELKDKHLTLFIRYEKGLISAFEACQKPRDRNVDPIIVWIWGRAGSGKSRAVHDKFGQNVVTLSNPQYFDAYCHEKAVLFDDFGKEYHCKLTKKVLLSLTDRYPYTCNVKGSSKVWNPTYIFFTCDRSPEDFFKNIVGYDQLDYEQIIRRITHIFGLPKDQDALELYLDDL